MTDVDIEGCSELLLGKMKFLSEGKETPSPVQIWVEQLEVNLSLNILSVICEIKSSFISVAK